MKIKSNSQTEAVSKAHSTIMAEPLQHFHKEQNVGPTVWFTDINLADHLMFRSKTVNFGCQLGLPTVSGCPTNGAGITQLVRKYFMSAKLFM